MTPGGPGLLGRAREIDAADAPVGHHSQKKSQIWHAGVGISHLGGVVAPGAEVGKCVSRVRSCHGREKVRSTENEFCFLTKYLGILYTTNDGKSMCLTGKSMLQTHK
jgi:hypothetical protein